MNDLIDQVLVWVGWYSIATHLGCWNLEQCRYAPLPEDRYLPCSVGGKLGPHKGDPALYPHECDGCT